MALDSNSPGDERGVAASAERTGGAGLKLVGERSHALGASSSASSSERASGASNGPERGVPGASIPTAKTSGARTAGRRLPLWLFIALLVAFVIAFGYQTHHAGRLETEVARLEASLAQAESRLESHRTHLLEIRGGVHDLTTRLESLRTLIDRDPTVEPSTDLGAEVPSEAPTAP